MVAAAVSVAEAVPVAEAAVAAAVVVVSAAVAVVAASATDSLSVVGRALRHVRNGGPRPTLRLAAKSGCTNSPDVA